MKPATGTIVRTALLLISLVNLFLAACGIVPEELVANDQLYKIGSVVVTAIISVINAWQNNSFTPEAIEADRYLEELKSKSKGDTPKG